MANTCRTIYICEGTQEQIQDLESALVSISSMKEPYVENGWGSHWLGCLIEYLGGKWEEWECRGEIVGFDVDKGAITIDQDTAWREQPGVRHFLEQHYPGMKIYWQDEEPGCNWYATNDKECRYFKDRYYLECSEMLDSSEYFDDLPSAIHAVEEILGYSLDLDPTTDPETAEGVIQKALDNYIDDSGDEDAYAHFSRFSIIND